LREGERGYGGHKNNGTKDISDQETGHSINVTVGFTEM
jgi:hypothetical protein